VLRAFANLKLAYKLLIPVLVLVAGIGTIVWTSYEGVHELDSAITDVIENTAARRAGMLQIQAQINDATVQEKNAIVSRDPTEAARYQQQYKASIGEAFAVSDTLMTLAKSAEAKEANQKLRELVTAFDGMNQKSIGLAVKGEFDAAAKVSSTEGRDARRAVRDLAAARTKAVGEEMKQARAKTASLVQSVEQSIFSITAGALAVSPSRSACSPRS
jgi:hypothetical protein